MLAIGLILLLISARVDAARIGINVLLKGPITNAALADLGKHGKVLDTIPEVNAVMLNADSAELPAIQSLSCVKTANPDRPRFRSSTGKTERVTNMPPANQWNLDAINVTDFGVGRTVAYDGSGVYVAVLDGGLVSNWRDYLPVERIATQFARSFGGGGGDKGAVSEQPELWEHDTEGHGTQVTSVILGFKYSGPLELPAVFDGVAPGATIIPVKVFNNNANGTQLWSSVFSRGLIYLTNLKTSGALGSAPLVVNMSFGGEDPDSVDRAVIDYAIAHGVILVSGAGNSGDAGMKYPGAYAPVISPGGTGWVEQLSDPTRILWLLGDVAEDDPTEHFVAPFSGRELPGQDLDFVAPAVFIPIPSTRDGRLDYAFGNGNSFATPEVAGIAALMLQKNPHLIQSQIEQILESTAMPIGPGCRDVIWAGVGPGNDPTWSDFSNVFFFPATFCWGANATGHGLVQANKALDATPAP
jgi:subtilisin family serine protease